MALAVVGKGRVRPGQTHRLLADGECLGVRRGQGIVGVGQRGCSSGITARIRLSSGHGHCACIAPDQSRRRSRRRMTLTVIGEGYVRPSQIHRLLADGESLGVRRGQRIVVIGQRGSSSGVIARIRLSSGYSHCAGIASDQSRRRNCGHMALTIVGEGRVRPGQAHRFLADGERLGVRCGQRVVRIGQRGCCGGMIARICLSPGHGHGAGIASDQPRGRGSRRMALAVVGKGRVRPGQAHRFLADGECLGVRRGQRIVGVGQPGCRCGVIACARLSAGHSHCAGIVSNQSRSRGSRRMALTIVGERRVRPGQTHRLLADGEHLGVRRGQRIVGVGQRGCRCGVIACARLRTRHSHRAGIASDQPRRRNCGRMALTVIGEGRVVPTQAHRLRGDVRLHARGLGGELIILCLASGQAVA